MSHDSLKIHCPNMQCRAANPEEQTFCLNCHTRLPKRYLWVVNFSDQEFAIGETLADRFVFRGPQVVLDVRPGLLLETDYEIPDLFLPYLKLFPYRIHYSQFFTVIWVGETDKSPILLLDRPPLSPKDLIAEALPETQSQRPAAPVAAALPLTQAWPQARPLRQLNWVWQIAQLWDSFLAQGVAQSLITPALLRVEGPLLRILELHNDLPKAAPTLIDLGQMLSQFKSITSGSLNFLFAEVCDELIEEKITDSQTLSTRIEDLIATCRDPQPLKVSFATQTDPGVVRTHNEDQCFPVSGSYIQNSLDSLLIVCDGVGGHAGGEVASAIAIEALQEHLGNLILDTLSPNQIQKELATACCHANDLISQRNDQEQRQERARMGTTLVMALVRDQQLYIAHVGDSRAYLVTKLGCYQLTVDDDIASREVRLGYLPYYEALRQPTSGSLVQALGMASSKTLHPTVQRFILDDELVLLLCSDGLSDYDRVEELWQEELLPLLYRGYDLSSVTQRLITLANHLNGHDNVTVGVMNITYGQSDTPTQPTLKRADIDFKSTVPNVDELTGEDKAWLPSDQEQAEPFQPPQQQPRRRKSKRSPWIMLPLLGILAAVLAGTAWAAFTTFFPRSKSPAGINKSPSLTETLPPPPSVPNNIGPNQVFKVSRSEELEVYINAQPLLSPQESPAEKGKRASLPQESVLKTINIRKLEPESSDAENADAENADAEIWLEIQLCTRPKKDVTNSSQDVIRDSVQSGEQAWVTQKALIQNARRIDSSDVLKLGLEGCPSSSSQVKSTPNDFDFTGESDAQSSPQ